MAELDPFDGPGDFDEFLNKVWNIGVGVFYEGKLKSFVLAEKYDGEGELRVTKFDAENPEFFGALLAYMKGLLRPGIFTKIIIKTPDHEPIELYNTLAELNFSSAMERDGISSGKDAYIFTYSL